MSVPIGLQLYTLRDALSQDFEGVMRQIADIGYAGVELAGFDAGKVYGIDHVEAAALFKELGLQVFSGHFGLPYTAETLEAANVLGCQYIVVPWIPEERFRDLEGIQSVCDELNAANTAVRAAGLTMAYHNHHWEFMAREDLQRRRPFDLMLGLLDTSIAFEVDTYWVFTGGSAPEKVLSEHGARIPLLHLKDGPAVISEPMVAVGSGVMDFPKILAESSALWQYVELDACATDMLDAVRKSYVYLTEKSLGYGR